MLPSRTSIMPTRDDALRGVVRVPGRRQHTVAFVALEPRAMFEVFVQSIAKVLVTLPQVALELLCCVLGLLEDLDPHVHLRLLLVLDLVQRCGAPLTDARRRCDDLVSRPLSRCLHLSYAVFDKSTQALQLIMPLLQVVQRFDFLDFLAAWVQAMWSEQLVSGHRPGKTHFKHSKVKWPRQGKRAQIYVTRRLCRR